MSVLVFHGLLDHVVGGGVVDVLATKMGVTGGSQNLEDSVVDKQGDVLHQDRRQ